MPTIETIKVAIAVYERDYAKRYSACTLVFESIQTQRGSGRTRSRWEPVRFMKA